MLTSTSVHLRAVAPGELPNTTGQFGHAAFLLLVQTVAPDLSAALHANNGRQPFTVSPLRVIGRSRANGAIHLRAGDACAMRFTILDPALFESFQRAFIESPVSATIRLQQVNFAVEEVITTPRPASPLKMNTDEVTGYTTFADLMMNARADKTIALHFDSPTAFSLGDTAAGKRFELFPQATLVFDSLCRRWNEFSDLSRIEPEALRAWVNEAVWVSEHNLHTEMLAFDRFAQKGFVGRVVFQIKRNDEVMTRLVNALADFALYAGVGYRTTWGMGQCRRVVE